MATLPKLCLSLAVVASLLAGVSGGHEVVTCPLKGVQRNFQITDLPNGWTVHYDAPYSDPTSIPDIRPLAGKCLLWGAKEGSGSPEFSVMAFGDRHKIESAPTTWDNEVYWYTIEGKASGFSPLANIDLRPGDQGPYQCENRLSWLLEGTGGYRAGCELDLENNRDRRKIVMYGPNADFCQPGTCPRGYYSRTDTPPFCKDAQCTLAECCAAADTCRASVCSASYRLKPVGLPDFCGASSCQSSECCDPKPTCQAADCPSPGYVLKRRPPIWCLDLNCTVPECCDPAPRCADLACRTGEVPSASVFCSSQQCLFSECCRAAGACTAAVCTGTFTPKASGLPAYCAGAACAPEECCDPPPPTENVSAVAFVDLDLDASELGGVLRWAPPAVANGTISHYAVYAGSSAADRRLLGTAPWGASEFTVSMNTPGASAFLIYSANSGGEQAVPAVFAISDEAYLLRNLTFEDKDLDAGELGGVVMWDPPSSLGPVTHHAVYLAGPSDAAAHLDTLANGTNELSVAVDTPLASFSQVEVFARAQAAQQTSPAAALAIVDTAASVSELAFIDEEGEPGLVGGRVTWTPPPSTRHVTSYRVYFVAANVSDLTKLPIVSDLDPGVTEAAIPLGTAKGNYTQVCVYTVSSLAEQSTPATAPLREKQDTVLLVMLAAAGSLGVLRALSVVAGTSIAARTGGPVDLEELERPPANFEHNPMDVPVTDTFIGRDNMRVVIRHLEMPCARKLFSSLFPVCVHPHHRKIVLHHSGSSTLLYRHSKSKNSWYGSGMLVRKLTNNVISVHGLGDKKIRFERKRPRCPRRLSGKSLDVALRTFVPLFVLLCVAAGVIVMGELALGLALVGIALVCLLLVSCFSRPASPLSICLSAVADAPPARFRRHFWMLVALFMAVLPCLPAFLSLTLLGVATGSDALLGALLCLLGYDRLAAWFEVAGGVAFSALAVARHFELKADDPRGAGVMTAVFLTAALMVVKGVDGVLKLYTFLYINVRLPDDPLVAKAQEISDVTGLSTVRSMALEAFATQQYEVQMQENLVRGLQSFANRLADMCSSTLERAHDELNGEHFKKAGQTLDHYLTKMQCVMETEMPVSADHAKVHVEELHLAMTKLCARACGEVGIKRCRDGISKMQSACRKLEKALDIMSRVAPPSVGMGHRVATRLWGTHGRAVSSMARDTDTRLTTGPSRALQLGRLKSIVEVLCERAVRARDLLEGLRKGGLLAKDAPAGNPGPSLASAKATMDRLEHGLDAVYRLLRPQTPVVNGQATNIASSEMNAMTDWFSDIIHDANEIERASQRLQETTAPVGDADDSEALKMDPEVREIFQTHAPQCQDQDILEAAVISVSVARNVAAIGTVVLEEVQSAVDRAERAVQTLLDARADGQRTVDTLRRAQKNFVIMSYKELIGIQDQTEEVLGGTVVSAAVRLNAVGGQDKLGRLQEHVKEELTRAKLPLFSAAARVSTQAPGAAVLPSTATKAAKSKSTDVRKAASANRNTSKKGTWRVRKASSDPSNTGSKKEVGSPASPGELPVQSLRTAARAEDAPGPHGPARSAGP